MSLPTSNGMFFCYFKFVFFGSMQAISAFTAQSVFPHSFSCRRFQGSASSSDCISKGGQLSLLFFILVFFFPIVYLLFMQTIFGRLKVPFFLRQTIFSLRVFVSRQGPRWSGLTPNACVMTPVWKRTCSSEFRSGCYGWVFAKLFI